MKSDLSIAFLTSNDPNNRNSWSGASFQMMKSLREQFTSVQPLGPIRLNLYLYLLTKFVNLANKLFSHHRYDISRSKVLSKYYAPIFKKKIEVGNFDLIFAPASAMEIAFLDTDLPICYFSDTSVSQIKDYYGTFSNLSTSSEIETELIQYRALQNSKIVIHSSKWATDHVIAHYDVKEERSFTVAWGANIDIAPNIKCIESKLTKKTTCNLLLLGVDWERKGGAIAFETLLELNKMGIDARLTVCGCTPPINSNHEKMHVIPFLDKNKKEQYELFLELMSNTHFLILPTRAECSAFVYAEASAYGIPSITTNTGGVASMVENDVNGFMLSLDAGALEYSNLIKTLFEDVEKYRKLVYSSRAKYDNELNWNIWGEKVKEIILNNYNK